MLCAFNPVAWAEQERVRASCRIRAARLHADRHLEIASSPNAPCQDCPCHCSGVAACNHADTVRVADRVTIGTTWTSLCTTRQHLLTTTPRYCSSSSRF